MKITFLTPTLELHGGNIVMLKHADYLIDHGHDVTIITTNKPIELPVNSKIKIIQYKKFGPKYFDFLTFQLIYLHKVVNLLEDCDIIIPIYAPLIIHAINAKQKKHLKAKIVPLFQDSLVTIWAGPYIRYILKTNYLNNNIDGLIAVSRPGKKGYEKLSGRKAEFIPIAIENDHFHPRELDKKNYVLFVGRPNKPKGFPVFQEAFNIIRQERPEFQAVVVAPTVDNKTENGITFVKYKDREQLAKIYNQARIYLSCSYAESFPMPPLEAMASKTATVITNTGGEKEYAVNGKNALIVPVGDARGIAKAALKIINDQKLMASLEKEGLKTAAQYSWVEASQKMEQYLIDILS